MGKIFTFTLFLLVLATHSAYSATYYVSVNGSNSNSGTESSPFRTITYAYSRVMAGDTILVQPGRYTDYTSGTGLSLWKDGTASAPITIKSIVRGAAIIDAQQNTLNPTVVAINGSYNILEGFRITNHLQMGIGMWGGHHNIIRHNEVDHIGLGTQPTRHTGIYTDDTSEYNLYDGNYVHDNGNFATNLKGHGFYITGSNETYINNIVTGNAGYGFQIYAYNAMSNVVIYNNTSAFNGGSGMVFYAESAGETFNGVHVKNNIFYRNYQSSYGADAAVFILIASGSYSGGGIVFDTNINFGNSRDIQTSGSPLPGYTSANWLRSDPKFAGVSDFHLLPGSPAMGTGLALTSLVPHDFDGYARSIPMSIGAYQSAPAPTAKLSAAPASIVSGQVTTLSWTSTNADSCSGSGFSTGGAISGSISLSPTATTTYSMTCSGKGGSVAISTSVTVTLPAPPPPPPPPPPPSPNLVKNGGFESGIGSWTNWGNALATSVTQYAGTQSLRVGTGDGGVGQVISGVVPGATYVLTVYAKVGSSNQSSFVGVQARGSSGQLITFKNAKVTSTSWALYQVTITAPSSTNSLVVYVWNNSGPSHVYVDEMRLTKN